MADQIQRLNFDFDYLNPAQLASAGASQVVIAHGVAHWSGIVAARHTPDGHDFPATTTADQLAFILERIDRCLAGVGTSRENILTLTMFTTDIDGLSKSLRGVFAPWAGEHRPTVTVIGVSRLSWPQLNLEIQGSALVPATRA